MSRSSSVLVLGASGALGSHVARLFASERPSWQLDLQMTERFADGQALRSFLATRALDAVVNCVGYRGDDPLQHFLVNACLPRVVGDWAERTDTLFIHISTNAVFAADETRQWLPYEPTAPRTPYEVAKDLGEDGRAYVIRTSFVGRDPKGRGLFEALLGGLPFSSRKFNGVTTLALARRCMDIIETHGGRLTPLVEHFHSPDVVTFERIAHLLRSQSRCIGYRSDARLLGGGIQLPAFEDQLKQYLAYLATTT